MPDGGQPDEDEDGEWHYAHGHDLPLSLEDMDPDAVDGSESRDERAAADSDEGSSGSDPIPDGGSMSSPPAVSVGDRVTAIFAHDGGPEHVEAIVATVHAPKTIDAVYRVESRTKQGGDGTFERDHHTDRYDFQTSLVYMADVAGWRKGWDDA